MQGTCKASRYHRGAQIQWPPSPPSSFTPLSRERKCLERCHHLQTFEDLDNLSMAPSKFNRANNSWYLKEQRNANIPHLQTQHQFDDIYVLCLLSHKAWALITVESEEQHQSHFNRRHWLTFKADLKNNTVASFLSEKLSSSPHQEREKYFF